MTYQCYLMFLNVTMNEIERIAFDFIYLPLLALTCLLDIDDRNTVNLLCAFEQNYCSARQ